MRPKAHCVLWTGIQWARNPNDSIMRLFQTQEAAEADRDAHVGRRDYVLLPVRLGLRPEPP